VKPLVGRAAELAVVERLLMTADRRPRIVSVHGPGGIGKSRLLAEIGRLARDTGRQLRVLRSVDIEGSSRLPLAWKGLAVSASLHRWRSSSTIARQRRCAVSSTKFWCRASRIWLSRWPLSPDGHAQLTVVGGSYEQDHGPPVDTQKAWEPYFGGQSLA
jgi:hypothetical protein